MHLTARWICLLVLAATLAPPLPVARSESPQTAAQSDDGLSQLHVADGFVVEVAAIPPLVERPITAAFDDNGYLYVAESSGSNDPVEQQLAERPHRIVRLADRDGDGQYDERVVFADRMMFPEGTMFHDGSLYVSAPPSIWKLTDADGDGVAEQREEWFKGTLTGCANDLHGPYAGPDGWIYWCKGAFAEQTHQVNGREFRSRASHIWRCRPDGSGLEPVMTGGMDNPVDIVFTPSGERIFSATFLEGDGRRDGLAHAIYGGVYGKNHGVLDGHPRTGELMPALLLMNSAAPSGLERYESTAFGPEYRDNLFAAQFNTRKVSRHRLQAAGSTFTTVDSDLLWSENVDFHPTDVLMDADGSLLVIDTGGWYKLCCPTSQLWKPDVLGGIYRVRRNGSPPVDDPRGMKLAWEQLSAPQLWELLGDARPAVRDRAARLFAKQRDPDMLNQLLTANEASHILKAKALPNACDQLTADLARTWSLIRIENDAAKELLQRLLAHEHPRIRQAALHGVSLHRNAAAAPAVFALLADEDAAVRRTAAEACGRLGDPAAILHLLKAAQNAPDRILQHSLIYALIELNDPVATRQGLAVNDPDAAAVALIALDQMPSGDLDAIDVISHLDADATPLRDAANWIVARRPDWGGQLKQWLQMKLAALDGQPAELNADDRSENAPAQTPLEAMLAAFASGPEIQALIAATAADATQPAAARRLALRAMARAAPTESSLWSDALAAAIAERDADLVPLALAAAQRQSPTPPRDSQLFEALTNLFSDDGAELSQRLVAAALVVPHRETLSDAEVEFLLQPFADEALASNRSLAADALARALLNSAQLQRVAAAIGFAGPLELNKLTLPFANGDDVTAEALLTALAESPALPALRLDRLRDTLQNRGPAVVARLDALEKLLNVDAEQQRARIEELLPAMASGDARRGHEVFNSAKASCSACHRMGYGGGNTGPELSKIGEVRTERDLLESILFPSLSFVRSYEPMLLVTDDGRAVAGVIRSETESEFVVATGPNEEVRVERSSVEEVQPNTISVMPAGLDKQLSARELADLVAFLKNAK